MGLELYGSDVFAASDGGGGLEHDGVAVVVCEVCVDGVANIDINDGVAELEVGDEWAFGGGVAPGVIGGELV